MLFYKFTALRIINSKCYGKSSEHYLFQNDDILIWRDILREVVSINSNFLVGAALPSFYIQGRVVSVAGEKVVMYPTFK